MGGVEIKPLLWLYCALSDRVQVVAVMVLLPSALRSTNPARAPDTAGNALTMAIGVVRGNILTRRNRATRVVSLCAAEKSLAAGCQGCVIKDVLGKDTRSCSDAAFMHASLKLQSRKYAR